MAQTHQGDAAEGAGTAGGTAEAPIWLLLGEKLGDNAQVVNLAHAVGLPWLEKSVVVRPEWREGKPRVRPALDHLDLERSDPLESPWPRIVITAGRRMSSVALWIKRASGGRTRVVLVGKPRRRLREIDLIVAAAHYVLPDAPNVVRHGLPFMHVDEARLEAARSSWASRLADLPRPLTALMVGGPTGGLRFDLDTGRTLFERSLAIAEAQGGSLYVTTSRRTPAAVVDWLRSAQTGRSRLYVFDPAASRDENPYLGLLALADHFVVTTDSASMMVEVAQLGRPLSLHPLEADTGGLERALEGLGLLRRLDPRQDPQPAGGLRARLMYRLGWPMHSRDLSAIPRWLVERGRAVWLGDPPTVPPPFEDEALAAIAARIRAMVEAP